MLTSPYWIWRAWRKRELGMTLDRLGFTAWPGIPTDDTAGRLWIHAVSVGEVQAATALLGAIRRKDPRRPLVLTVTTRTGCEVARRTLSAVPHVTGPLIFPLDLPWAVSRRLGEVQPRALIFVDTEIWPNLIRAAANRQARLFLVNGRISDQSFRRYLWIRPYLRKLFANFSCFWMQSEENVKRILALGAPPDRVRVGGNLKIDAMALTLQTQSSSAATTPADPPLLLIASTHPGEESTILQAAKTWREHGRKFRLAIAPRHPERAGEVAGLIESHGFHPLYRSAVRSETEIWPPTANGSDILLIDTIGELFLFFPLASVIFVGGSLVPKGGHNIFEPAAFGRPVLHGPHMENFREAEEALDGHGAVRVQSADAFQKTAEDFLFDPQKAETVGKQAKQTFGALQGTAERISTELLEMV